MRAESLKGHLDFLLLAALHARPAHGYAVVEILRERSAGSFDLPEGTIYPALHRLERAGLLASRWSEAEGRRRKTYRLSVRGQQALESARHEWRAFRTAVEAVAGA
jgi:DNA-binding PadR family transcriptional regulator